MTIYLDHHASTPILPCVWGDMLPFWTEAHGNPHSSEHSIGWSSHRAVEKARSQVANLIGADSNEIVFTSGATEANNLAVKGLCSEDDATHVRNRILISEIEHKCILESAAYVSKTNGCSIEYIPVDKKGYVDLDILEELLSSDVRLVSIAYVNNEIGTIQDIEKISLLCREAGVLFHSDFAQTPSAVCLDGLADFVDAISLSAHKFGGPMGVGALYISHEIQRKLKPLLHGGGQERGLRSGTLATPLCVGFGSAAEFSRSNEGALLRKKISCLRDEFVGILRSSNPNILLNGENLDLRHPGNANMQFQGYEAQDLLQRLQPRLSASSGSACSSGITGPSHVLKAIGLRDEEVRASIRFSFGHSNNGNDPGNAANLLLELL